MSGRNGLEECDSRSRALISYKEQNLCLKMILSAQITQSGLQTQNSRIFPGHSRKAQFFKESQGCNEKS